MINFTERLSDAKYFGFLNLLVLRSFVFVSLVHAFACDFKNPCAKVLHKRENPPPSPMS